MDEDTLSDLKQFIVAIVQQEASGIKSLRDELHEGLARVEQKIDDLSTSVAEAIDNMNEVTQSQLKDHERRIRRLEHTPS